MRSVRAAAVQISPVLYSREGTIDKVVRKIHQLGREGVQFATFPETVVPYYPYFSFIQSAYQIVAGREHLKLLEEAVTVPSPATAAVSDACKPLQPARIAEPASRPHSHRTHSPTDRAAESR
jgi:nitrilase